jgi:hypothetical protein
MLEKLKRRLGITGSTQDLLLADLIEEATAYVCGYTGRAEVPALLEPAVVWLAAAEYNQMGLEGEKSHSEGAVSQSIELLPGHLKNLLNMYRIAKVGDA